eukprot:TRINITY_DN24373_c0_g1_i1.p1 TRINITY_DN24373_c0_g1~~TRINITY_DN24373_c0_g1_i1.p1  ORF type:complete len:446 (-),score=74.04 TRINITY_DN24373_c0_g1_i1:339-1676(-)
MRIDSAATDMPVDFKLSRRERRRRLGALSLTTGVAAALWGISGEGFVTGRQLAQPIPVTLAAHTSLSQLPAAGSGLTAAKARPSRVQRSAAATEAADQDGGIGRRLLLGAGGTAAFLAFVKRFGIDGPPEYDPLPGTLLGRRILVTGGNVGLGKESAVRLAKGGATVVITARTEDKGKKAVDDIKKASGSSDVHYLLLDLGDLQSVKSFPQRFEKEAYGDRIDVLMNNAGVMAIPERQETVDGFERQFGVNHLGHFALTGLLLPLLKKAQDGARVIAVSSTAHLAGTKDMFDGNPMAPEKYTQWGAYCQSKLANVLFAKELDRKFKDAGINATAVSCHPGGVDTDLPRWTVDASGGDIGVLKKARAENPAIEAVSKYLTRTVQLGANTQVYLAAGADAAGKYNKSGGEYFDNMAPGLLNPAATDDGLAKSLWEESERLTGVKYSI